MRSEFGYTLENVRYRCIATRADRSWGHGLEVEIFDADGGMLNVVYFSCHPEFPNYETLQAMNTEQLVGLVSCHLQSGKLTLALTDARKADLQLYCRFEIG